MSNLSGYDSDAVGFSSISRSKRADTTSSTQTTEYSETGMSSQTNFSTDNGCNVTPQDLGAEDEILKDYTPPGLNEFLRKVVPAMMEQLDQNENEMSYNSSDSEEEEVISARLFQEFEAKNDSVSLGSGDHEKPSILSLSWSSAGNSLALSIGYTQHENWCTHDGLIKVYTVKRTSGDHLTHVMDISEKNCVTVVKYHPSVAALLAYATISGEVVICNLMNSSDFQEGMQLTSPSGCHGSKRVTALQWADAPLANMFLTIQITNTRKRRGASDQILFSSGSDGTLNVWQVNSNLKIFENVICYFINGSRKMAAPDITSFDFIKSYPLRPCDEKVADDLFVVGTKCGRLFLCKIKGEQSLEGGMVDPVYEMLEGHSTCILDVAFNYQKPGLFASISIDSELRLYDINQSAPLKVICLDMPVSCMCWLPNNPCVVVVGLSCDTRDQSQTQSLRIYNVSTGRAVPVDGLTGGDTVTAVAVSQSGWCRIAAGDTNSQVKIWDIPARRIRMSAEDLQY